MTTTNVLLAVLGGFILHEYCPLSRVQVGVLVVAGHVGWTMYRYVKSGDKRRKLEARMKIEQNKRVENVAGMQMQVDRVDSKDLSRLNDQQLIDDLQSGDLTAEEVLRHFQSCALAIHATHNCIIEFLDDAVDRARQLDEQYRGKEKPLLFGMPFSVKENLQLTGHPTSRALVAHLDTLATSDCTIVAHLVRLGAVPFVRTNVPQTMMSIACANPIWGRTDHPTHLGFTPGGSSGGEACLVALRGCMFGVGSDLAGSLRIPAVCSGVITLKPTAARLATLGARSAAPGNVALKTAYGYFTRSVRMLELLMSVTLSDNYFNTVPYCVPLPYQLVPTAEQTTLNIAYYIDDGFLTPTAPCRRAVTDSANALRAQGHNLVEWKLPRMTELVELFFHVVAQDGGAELLRDTADEPIEPMLKDTLKGMRLHRCIRQLLALVAGRVSTPMSTMFAATVRDHDHLSQLFAEIAAYKTELSRVWMEKSFDALLCPALPITAPMYSYTPKLSVVCYGTGIFNMLDMTAATLPVTTITENDLDVMKFECPPSAWHDPLQYSMHKATMEKDMPVSVQIVTMPYREEMCVEVMRIVEESATL